MKRIISVFTLAAIAVLVLVAGYFDAPAVANLGYEVVADTSDGPGGGVKLYWDFPEGWNPGTGSGSGCYAGEGGDTSYFRIYADGTVLGTTDTNVFNVYKPSITLEVVAVYGRVESDPLTLDFSVVETQTLELWTSNDPSPEHPSCFGFNDNGSAFSYSISGQDTGKIDYCLDLGQSNLPAFTSPSAHVPAVNAEDNSTSTESGSYSALGIVAPPGLHYNASTSILEGGVYGFWLNEGGVYDASADRFGKISAESVTIEGTSGGKYIYKVVLRLACQTAPGLRWVKTP